MSEPLTYRQYGTVSGELDVNWPATGASSVLRASAVFDGKLFLGGDFTSHPTTTDNASRIIAFDGTNMLNVGSLLTGGGLTNPDVRPQCLTASDDTLYANVANNNLQRWDKDTNTWVSIHNFSSTITVSSMIYHAGTDTIYMGSRFSGATRLRQHNLETTITIPDNHPTWITSGNTIINNLGLFNNGDLFLSVLDITSGMLRVGRYTHDDSFELIMEDEDGVTNARIFADIADDRIFLPGGREYLIDEDEIVVVDANAAANTDTVIARQLSDGTPVVMWSVEGEDEEGSYITVGDDTFGPFATEQDGTWRGIGVINDVIYWQKHFFTLAQGSTFAFDVELLPPGLAPFDKQVRAFVDGEETFDFTITPGFVTFDSPIEAGQNAVVLRETRTDRTWVQPAGGGKLYHPAEAMNYYRQFWFIAQERCEIRDVAEAIGAPLFVPEPSVPASARVVYDDLAEDTNTFAFGGLEFLPSPPGPSLSDQITVEVEFKNIWITLTQVASNPDNLEYTIDGTSITTGGDWGSEDAPIRITRKTRKDKLWLELDKDGTRLSSNAHDFIIRQIVFLLQLCPPVNIPDFNPLSNHIFPRGLNFLSYSGPGDTFNFRFVPWLGDGWFQVWVDDFPLSDLDYDVQFGNIIIPEIGPNQRMTAGRSIPPLTSFNQGEDEDEDEDDADTQIPQGFVGPPFFESWGGVNPVHIWSYTGGTAGPDGVTDTSFTTGLSDDTVYFGLRYTDILGNKYFAAFRECGLAGPNNISGTGITFPLRTAAQWIYSAETDSWFKGYAPVLGCSTSDKVASALENAVNAWKNQFDQDDPMTDILNLLTDITASSVEGLPSDALKILQQIQDEHGEVNNQLLYDHFGALELLEGVLAEPE